MLFENTLNQENHDDPVINFEYFHIKPQIASQEMAFGLDWGVEGYYYVETAGFQDSLAFFQHLGDLEFGPWTAKDVVKD